jgi:hypothetical protein
MPFGLNSVLVGWTVRVQIVLTVDAQYPMHVIFILECGIMNWVNVFFTK